MVPFWLVSLVKLLVCGGEPRRCDVSIDLGISNVCMAKKRLNQTEIVSAIKHMSCPGMSEYVRAKLLCAVALKLRPGIDLAGILCD